MHARLILVLTAFGCLVGTSQAEAKGRTVQLSITGPGLEVPFHSAEPALIAANLWVGNFADWEAGPIAAPSENVPRFRVYFWMQIPRGSVEMKYTVSYQWLEEEHRGVICFPEAQSHWNRVNSFTMSRRQYDGKCLYAAEPWGNAVREALQISE